jgi:hypothetical protein
MRDPAIVSESDDIDAVELDSNDPVFPVSPRYSPT